VGDPRAQVCGEGLRNTACMICPACTHTSRTRMLLQEGQQWGLIVA
jgi:hypothetical protein